MTWRLYSVYTPESPLQELADGNYGFNDGPFAGDNWTRFQRLQKRTSRENS